MQLARELVRPAPEDAAMVEPGREVEAHVLPTQLHCLSPDEHSRVVTSELDGARVGERAVPEGPEVAGPGLRDTKDPRMAQRDVDRAERARRKSRNRAIGLSCPQRQARIRPGNDVANEVRLPPSGPFLVAALARHPSRDRHTATNGLTR